MSQSSKRQATNERTCRQAVALYADPAIECAQTARRALVSQYAADPEDMTTAAPPHLADAVNAIGACLSHLLALRELLLR